MFHLNDEIEFAEERRRKLLREAKIQQLFHQAEEDRANAGDRLMRLIGDLMIVGGTKLKARAQTAEPLRTPYLQNM